MQLGVVSDRGPLGMRLREEKLRSNGMKGRATKDTTKAALFGWPPDKNTLIVPSHAHNKSAGGKERFGNCLSNETSEVKLRHETTSRTQIVHRETRPRQAPAITLTFSP